jgi:hypothetical protein
VQVQVDLSFADTTIFYHILPSSDDAETRKQNYFKMLFGFLGERCLVFCNVMCTMCCATPSSPPAPDRESPLLLQSSGVSARSLSEVLKRPYKLPDGTERPGASLSSR